MTLSPTGVAFTPRDHSRYVRALRWRDWRCLGTSGVPFKTNFGYPWKETMTNLETIQEAEARIATLQGQLDNAQRVLQKVEKAAVIGETVKRRALPILVAASVLTALIGGLLVARVFKKKRDRTSKSDGN